MSRAKLSIRGLRVQLGGHTILEDFNLDVAAGERLVIAGPSGSGKSTLLRAIAGLVPTASGEIQLGGRSIQHLAPGRRGIGMVFQQPTLLPHLSVRDNLAFGLRARGSGRREARRRAGEVAGWLEIGALLDRHPRELSGGEQQRVALGRALLREEGLILLDEPLSQLDAPLRARLREELLRLHERVGTTLVHVTHDQQEAMALGHRIGVLEAGTLLQIDRPHDLYRRPCNRRVAQFLGIPAINLIELEQRDGRPCWQGQAVPAPTHSGALQLGLRPEQLRPAGAGEGGWAVTLLRREMLGDRELWQLRDAAGTTLVMSRPVSDEIPDEALRITADFAAASYFDAASGERIESC